MVTLRLAGDTLGHMTVSRRERCLLLGVWAIAAIAFLPGVRWGLPSRDVDKYLFGDHPVWTGEQILALAGGRAHDRSVGADVDRDALDDRSDVVTLNDTDAKRAEIVRRYRLYTRQPDEMITMMALASMRPGEGDFDPKLYQYGGLWTYPVGALIKIASLVGVVHLTSDLAYYLDHPEAFGRFYIVARLYVVLFGFIGVWGVFAITKRLTNGSLVPASFAAACFAVMPVVVNMAHEAKPHLPAAVLMLLTVLAAMRWVESGGAKTWWIMTSGLCGASFGMVLSALPVFVILPVGAWLAHRSWRQFMSRTIVGGVIGGAVYLITNPYIPINLFTNPEVLRSNFGNSLAMYEIARIGEGFINAARLVAEGAGPIGAAGGVLALIILNVRAALPPFDKGGQGGVDAAVEASFSYTSGKRVKEVLPSKAYPGIGLLTAPAAVILLQFVALAAGKPGEYGRFAVFPNAVLVIAAVVLTRRLLPQPRAFVGAASILVIATAVFASRYWVAFRQDSGTASSRLEAAQWLRAETNHHVSTLGLFAEPAPYNTPPANLFDIEWQLLPEASLSDTEFTLPDQLVVVNELADRRAIVDAGYRLVYPKARLYFLGEPVISWADKRINVYVNRHD